MFKYIFGMKYENGFGSGTTSKDIGLKYSDIIKDKNVLITGCSSGIGLETVEILAIHGAKVIMACRNMEKTKKAIDNLKKKNPNNNLNLIPIECDLSSFESIRKCVKEFLSMNISLNILINNAGIMACPLSHTKDGHELQFGTNHLGHFLLTELLLDNLKQSGKASSHSRIINVASEAHRFSYKEGIKFNDLKGEKKYDAWKSYGQSKLSNVLHAKSLQERFNKDESKYIHAYSLHPGIIGTPLYKHTLVNKIFYPIFTLLSKSVPQGAATTMYCAVDPELNEKGHGEYFTDCQIDKAKNYGNNSELCQKLYEISLKMIEQ